jgi:hypothetical protein
VLVVAGRDEDIGADGATGGDFLVSDSSAEDKRVAEEQARLISKYLEGTWVTTAWCYVMFSLVS